MSYSKIPSACSGWLENVTLPVSSAQLTHHDTRQRFVLFSTPHTCLEVSQYTVCAWERHYWEITPQHKPVRWPAAQRLCTEPGRRTSSSCTKAAGLTYIVQFLTAIQDTHLDSNTRGKEYDLNLTEIHTTSVLFLTLGMSPVPQEHTLTPSALEISHVS